MAIDETRLNAFMGNFVHDIGAVMHAEGGFMHLRRTSESPFNPIFEARP